MKLLLDKSDDKDIVNAHEMCGLNAFHVVCSLGRSDAVPFFLACDKVVHWIRTEERNQTVLHVAAGNAARSPVPDEGPDWEPDTGEHEEKIVEVIGEHEKCVSLLLNDVRFHGQLFSPDGPKHDGMLPLDAAIDAQRDDVAAYMVKGIIKAARILGTDVELPEGPVGDWAQNKEFLKAFKLVAEDLNVLVNHSVFKIIP